MRYQISFYFELFIYLSHFQKCILYPNDRKVYKLNSYYLIFVLSNN